MEPVRRRRPQWLIDAERIDLAVYAAVAATPSPSLDRAMRDLSRAADHSFVWIGLALAVAAGRGHKGRQAAKTGLASTAVASAIVNLVAKPILRRHRPDRVASKVPLARHVDMPASGSLPSGHAASAFAFATGTSHVLDREGAALRLLAATVAYSRVHTGVHFPGDVIVGSLLGTVIAQTVTRRLDSRGGRA